MNSLINDYVRPDLAWNFLRILAMPKFHAKSKLLPRTQPYRLQSNWPRTCKGCGVVCHDPVEFGRHVKCTIAN